MKSRSTVFATVAASLVRLGSAVVDSGVTCRSGCPCLATTHTYESTSVRQMDGIPDDRTVIDGLPDMSDCPNTWGESSGRWCSCADHFPDPDEFGNFVKVTQDCEANTIDETTQGEWWKLDEAKTGIHFRGKANSRYHYSPNPMTKDNARAYCKSLGFHENSVHLHCPNGTNENNWLWYHHPWQPFERDPVHYDAVNNVNITWFPRGLLTGITRGRDFDNFDYWCDEDLYPALGYFNWAWTNPKMMSNNNRVFANHIYVGLDGVTWADTTKCASNGYIDIDDDGNTVGYKGCEGEGPYSIEDGTAADEYTWHFICEMNCDHLESERFIDRSECDVVCEDECYRGECSCRDVLKHAKKDGSCQYMAGTDLIHYLNYTDAAGQNGKGCPYYPDDWYTGNYAGNSHDNIFRKKRDAVDSRDSWADMVDELNDNDSPWNYYQMFEKEHPKADSCEAHPELCPYTLEYKATVENDDDDPLITVVTEELRAQIAANPQFRRTNHFGTHTDCPNPGTFFTMDQWETTSNLGLSEYNSPEVTAQVQGNRNLGGLFERMTEDCAGDPLVGLTETNGGWWRPKNPFPGKDQAMYHMISMSTNITYAKKYCKELSGLEAKGMPVGLHCPNSTIENHILWMSHPDQPLHNFPTDTTGIMTGIVRTVNLSAEHYWCDSCRYKQTYFLWRREGGGNSEPTWTARRALPYFNNPGQKHDDILCTNDNGCLFPNTLSEAAEDIILFENNIFLRYVQPDWSDMYTFNDQSFICEMNCKYYQEPCDPCANHWCPYDQMCEDGECVCTDEYAEINLDTGICEVQTNDTCPCDEPGCVLDIIIPPGDGEKIKEHGCHCTKLGPLSIVQNYVGGAGKIDEIDAICKRWFDARRCITLPGGSCFNFDLATLDYTLVIEGMSHVVSCEQIPNLPGDVATNKCLYDLCLIDTNYALMILYMLEDVTEDWTQRIVTEDMCPSCVDWTGSHCLPPTSCEGDAPWVKMIK